MRVITSIFCKEFSHETHRIDRSLDSTLDTRPRHTLRGQHHPIHRNYRRPRAGQLLVIPVQRNIAGQGSSLIQTYGDGEPYVLSENEGDYTGQYINAPDSIETFIPSGFGLSEDQDIIFEIYTYSEAWQNGKWTFFSRVSFKCATGEVNYIQIEDFGPAEPSIREVEVPVDGPAREIPGDIGPVSGQPEIMEINPQDNIIREMNEQEMRVPEAQISR